MEASDLEHQLAGRGRPPQGRGLSRRKWSQRRLRDPVGDDDGIDSPRLDQHPHVTADGGGGGRVGESAPVDLVEAELVVCVPHQNAPVPYPPLPEQIRGPAGPARRLPLLEEDDRRKPGCESGLDPALHHLFREGPLQVDALCFLPLVEASREPPRQLLGQAVEPHSAPALGGGKIGVPDEKEAGRIAGGAEGRAEVGDPDPEPPSLAVLVRALHRYDREGQRKGVHINDCETRARAGATCRRVIPSSPLFLHAISISPHSSSLSPAVAGCESHWLLTPIWTGLAGSLSRCQRLYA